MAQAVHRIVIARYKEDTAWVTQLPDHWQPIVVQKTTEDVAGDMTNVGREPASFALAILYNWSKIKPNDIWAFVQGNPFDHAPDLLNQLNQPVDGFHWLGEINKHTDGQGQPFDCNIPVARLYEQWTDRKWPDNHQVEFAAGGQFVLNGADILKHEENYYLRFMGDVCKDRNAWVAERLWAEIFNSVVADDTATITQLTGDDMTKTDDHKPNQGVMSDKDYAKQPESNVGATVDRDVDEPNAKQEPAGQVVTTDNIITEDAEEVALRERNHAQLMRDIEVEKRKKQEEDREKDKLADEMQKHVDDTTVKERAKPQSNTKP